MASISKNHAFLVGLIPFLLINCKTLAESAKTLSSEAALTASELSTIETKLSNVPNTRKILLSLLNPEDKLQIFDPILQSELELILRSTLINGDTDVSLLIWETKRDLGIDRGVVAFHKQGKMTFKIIPSRMGTFKDLKQNDFIRSLNNPELFKHAHNVFVDDVGVNLDSNTVSLLVHELSHAAFDQWITNNPSKIKEVLDTIVSKEDVDVLFHEGADGVTEIDADAYDYLSEKYAFGLEYRINLQVNNSNKFNWPFSFSFMEYKDIGKNYDVFIDSYVRKQYQIDHPALLNIETKSLEGLLVK